jgi:hypothetical protein
MAALCLKPCHLKDKYVMKEKNGSEVEGMKHKGKEEIIPR